MRFLKKILAAAFLLTALNANAITISPFAFNDPGANALFSWQYASPTTGKLIPLTLGGNCSITGTVFNCSGGGGGSVSSVFGRTGAVVAQSGDYNTSQVLENINLYFTNVRAIAALTGQNISIFNNNAGYITNAALAPYLTIVSAAATYYPLTNPAAYISNITGLVQQGSNITITGSGTSGSPYIINGTAGGVTSFNTRTGAVTLLSSDVTGALGYTPYDASNPSAYIALTDLSSGAGISYDDITGVITNSAPDQIVTLSDGSGISVTGTYPNFTITNTSPSSGGTVTEIDTDSTLTGGPITITGTLGIDLTNPNVWSGLQTFDNNISFGGAQLNVGTLVRNDLLQYDGTYWVNVTPSSVNLVTSVFGRIGAVVATSGDYNTSQVTEVTNLYFTNARAIAATLTGYVSGAGTISSTDSILSAIQKLNGNITALVTGVSSVSGDSALISNSTSTGAVTLTLTSATAKSLWGNSSASAGTPSYQTSPVVSGSMTANTFTSVVATGTAPFTVSSTTNVANLNASSLTGDVIGTAGATIPLNNGNLVLSGNDTFTAKLLINLAGNVTAPNVPTGTTLETYNLGGTNTVIANVAVAASSNFAVLRYNGTYLAKTALVSGDEIGGLNGWGATGINIPSNPNASVKMFANQNWSVGANGTYISLLTTPNGSATQAEVIRLENDAGVTVPATVTGGDKGAGTINAGGLYVNGSAVLTSAVTSVSGTTNRITSTGGTTPVIDISASYVGQTSITTLGTLTTGAASTGFIIGGVTMTLSSDATGDIYYRNSSGILTRLGIGSTGNILTVSGGLPSWAAPATSGTVTSIATTSPITGGTIISTGTIACATCVVASSPGAGIAHFAGSTQTITSSAVSLTADVSGILPIANGGTNQSSLTAHAILLGEGSTTGIGFATVATAGRILIDQGAAADPSFNALSGDCTITSAGAITCTKTNGVSFGTAATVNTGTTGATIPLNNAWVDNINLEDSSSGITAQTYTLDLYPAFGYTINQLAIKSGSGTATAAVQINGTNVTSLSAISVTSTVSVTSATGANTVSAGASNVVTLVISSPSSLNNLQVSVKYTRN